jgi:hypothetical protein
MMPVHVQWVVVWLIAAKLTPTTQDILGRTLYSKAKGKGIISFVRKQW